MTQPDSANWLQAMAQGQQDFQQGALASAIRHFDAATQIEPSQAEAWINLGVCQMQMGHLEAGLVSLQRAIKQNPNMMQAYMAIGDAHRLQGNVLESSQAYHHAAELEPTPLALNNLAGSLRILGKADDAEQLYQDALQMDPGFTLAKINLATVQIELQRFNAAREQINALAGLSLSPKEQQEIDSTSAALGEYFRLQPSVDIALQDENLDPLYAAISATPKPLLQVDEEVLEKIRHYADSARKLPQLPLEDTQKLPEDWPLIEALFMIPLMESVAGYRKIKDIISTENNPKGELLVSLNMERVVRDSYATIGNMLDPVKAETQLRYWHILATRGITNIVPGQFKMSRNLSFADTTLRRAEPHLASGTLRRFISEIYVDLPPGLPRGLVAYMAVSDIHAFADGNGRLGMVWLNRELESVGQFPVLFTREMGLHGQLSAAMREARRNGGDMSLLVPVICKAQQFAKDFCAELVQTTKTG